MPSGITTNQQPAEYTPVYNGQWFESTSTNSGATNFVYTVVCTDMITTDTLTYEIKKRLGGQMVFDAKNFSKNYIKNYIPNNLYGFQVCTDAVRQIKVNIGETYGGTPAYTSGADITYYVWNSAISKINWTSFNFNDYVYGSTEQILGVFPTGYTYDDKSQYIYFMGSSGAIAGIDIDVYDINGNLLHTSTIANPYAVPADYTEKYVCIDIGKKGLDNIASGLVTGTYPILPSNAYQYNIKDSSLSETLYKVMFINDECRYDVYTIHYKSFEGNFETIHCPKVSETNVTGENTYFKRSEYTLESNVWSYDNSTPIDISMTAQSKTRLRLNTDWLTEDECLNHQYLVSSPEVYVDMGSTIGLIPIKVLTKQWRVNKKWNQHLYNVALDIEFSYVDTYG